MINAKMICEAMRRATEIGLPDKVIEGIKEGHCFWQTDSGSLVDIDENSDPQYDQIREERRNLERLGGPVYYAFSGYICGGMQVNNYLSVSDDEYDWTYEDVKPCSIKGMPNLKILYLAVSSEMTHGTFDFGDSYVNCENGKLSRVSLSEVLCSSKTSIF